LLSWTHAGGSGRYNIIKNGVHTDLVGDFYLEYVPLGKTLTTGGLWPPETRKKGFLGAFFQFLASESGLG
jgi:hypothetical protein